MSRSQIKKRHSNKKSRNRKLEIGDKVLLLFPTSNNKLLMQWQGPLIVRDKVGEYDYRVEDKNGKIKTYHINMLKKYIDRRDMLEEKTNVEKEGAGEAEVVAFVSAIVHDGEIGIDGEEEILELYNSKQKENYKDVDINPGLSGKQKVDFLGHTLKGSEISPKVESIDKIVDM